MGKKKPQHHFPTAHASYKCPPSHSDSAGGWEPRECGCTLPGPAPCLLLGSIEYWSIEFIPREPEGHVSLLHPWFLEGTVASALTTMNRAVLLGRCGLVMAWGW